MSAASEVDLSRITLLEAIRRQGKEWDVLAPRYGVTNPESAVENQSGRHVRLSRGRRRASCTRSAQSRG